MKIYHETVSATPTITAGAYSANDAVGGILTFNLPEYFLQQSGFEIRGARVADKSGQAADLVLVLFSASPAGTFTDNDAFDPADADLGIALGAIQFTTHAAFSDNSLSYNDSFSKLGKFTRLSESTGAFYGAVYTTETPTYGSTSDLTFYLDLISNQYGS